jgi:diadenosine tetraphosphate (Ap4A) HIT family hydrolase
MSDVPVVDFALDPRLAADSHRIADGALCEFRLVDDARYGWIVLVPRVPGAEEWLDLEAEVQARLLRDVNAAGRALRALGRCDKLNIGALGNIVRQLHVHVVARHAGDPAWPGPVWGHSPLQRRDPALRDRRLAELRAQLAAGGGEPAGPA